MILKVGFRILDCRLTACSFRRSVAVICICLLFYPLAWIADASERAGGALREELLFMDIPFIVTASMIAQPLQEAPATVHVVTRKQIKERGYNNLLDLLKELPGVDVQDRCCEETYNEIRIRGINKQEKFIIMMDGHRISSPTGEKIPIAENFPLFNAKQVEVVYGPASALYGADAFAGVINIITRDAEKIAGWEVSASGGSFGYQNHHLNYGGSLSENIKLSAGGHWHEGDNADLRKYFDEYRLGDIYWDHDHDSSTPKVLLVAGEDRDFDMTTKSHSAYLKLVVKENFTLGYSRSFFRHPSGQGGKPDYALYNKDVKWETLINNYYADYTFEDGDNLSGETSVSYLTYEMPPDTKYVNKYTNFENGYKYANGKRFKLEQQLNVKLNEDNTLVGGITYEDFYSLPKTFDLDYPYNRDRAASEQGYFYPGTDNTIPLKIYELRYHNYGAYLQLQSELSRSISATLGIRYDENSRYGSTVNPRGGIVFRPGETTTIKLLYGEAYQAPSPYNAYAGFGAFDGDTDSDGLYDGGYFHLPNPDLEPEELKTYELGLIQDVSPDMRVDASLFYTEIDNMISDTAWFSSTSTFIEGGEITPWKRNENRAEAYYYGGELSADYRANLSGVKLIWWGNYSYIHGRQREVGSTKVLHKNIARYKIKTGITARHGRFYITPSIKWIGRTNNRYAESTTSYSYHERTVDDYYLVNMHMGIDNLTGNLSATLNIQNLTDKKYHNSGGSSNRHLAVAQEPRRIVLSLNYKF